MRAAWAWIREHVGVKEVQFYGALVLIGCAPWRWALVGGLLVLDVLLTPVLARYVAGRG